MKEKDAVAYIPSDAEIIYRLIIIFCFYYEVFALFEIYNWFFILSLEPFPSLENADPLDADYYKNLLNFLNDRIKKKNELEVDITSRSNLTIFYFFNAPEAIRNLVTPVATPRSVRPGFFNPSGHTTVCQTRVFFDAKRL